eukprot:gnl/TRDRNA2_/TRDRNA2_90473_c1_seq1.p1 gnl/TRDRNA2_/TRDRNA2_90473_c1~~gnl/TRDRNA2_/TRDRNA2_90473_c1_seq1.p1  ORF type:complete len:328 (-),score=73.60 gnl/TRDRNA2_/TRDRNA2_90473_c1_seq1:47-940(-)
MAPEVMKEAPRAYDHCCDLWSCGGIMYFLLAGQPPFESQTDAGLRAKVRSGVLAFQPAASWCDVSQEAMDMVQSLLCMSPAKRLTAEESLQHSWMKKKGPKLKDRPLQENLVRNLRSFRSQNKFKRAALCLIVSLLSEEQIREPRETFITLDVNGDGMFSLEELRQRTKKMPIKDKEVLPESIFHSNGEAGAADSHQKKKFSSNQSTVDDAKADYTYTEFLAAAFDRKRLCQKEVCRAAFNAFDRHARGRISKEDLSSGGVLGPMSEEDLAILVRDLDSNGDNEIDFEEFMAMMRSG